jgi:hypothetical protein
MEKGIAEFGPKFYALSTSMTTWTSPTSKNGNNEELET